MIHVSMSLCGIYFHDMESPSLSYQETLERERREKEEERERHRRELAELRTSVQHDTERKWQEKMGYMSIHVCTCTCLDIYIIYRLLRRYVCVSGIVQQLCVTSNT